MFDQAAAYATVSIMKKLLTTSTIGLAITIAAAFGLFPSAERSASCADCEVDNLAGIKRAFEVFAENCKKQVADSTDQKKACYAFNTYNKILPIMKALSKDNRFGPGNRSLTLGDEQNGNLPAGANRTFQTVAPLDKDSLNIEINKTEGGNGALVKICSVDDAGTVKRVGTVKFEETGETGKRSASLTGVQGKMIRIDIASFGGALKKFQYTLKAN